MSIASEAGPPSLLAGAMGMISDPSRALFPCPSSFCAAWWFLPPPSPPSRPCLRFSFWLLFSGEEIHRASLQDLEASASLPSSVPVYALNISSAVSLRVSTSVVGPCPGMFLRG